jgi:hypothetical protein
MNLLKCRGLKEDPCGTPDFTGTGKGSRNTNRKLSVGQTAMKRTDITRGKFEVSKLTKKQIMGNNIKSTI